MRKLRLGPLEFTYWGRRHPGFFRCGTFRHRLRLGRLSLWLRICRLEVWLHL
jgi:hypothetical protein